MCMLHLIMGIKKHSHYNYLQCEKETYFKTFYSILAIVQTA